MRLSHSGTRVPAAVLPEGALAPGVSPLDPRGSVAQSMLRRRSIFRAGPAGALRLRRDHEPETRFRLVVAHEGVLHVLRGEALILLLGFQHIVDGEPAIVEGGEPAQPETRGLEHL